MVAKNGGQGLGLRGGKEGLERSRREAELGLQSLKTLGVVEGMGTVQTEEQLLDLGWGG